MKGGLEQLGTLTISMQPEGLKYSSLELPSSNFGVFGFMDLQHKLRKPVSLNMTEIQAGMNSAASLFIAHVPTEIVSVGRTTIE